MTTIHKFDSKTMELPYVQEINRWIEMFRGHMIIQEQDIEYAPEVALRFDQRIQAKPDRIHAAPYLVQRYDTLFFVHRHRIRTVDKLYRRQHSESVPPPEVEVAWSKNKTVPMPVDVYYMAWVAGGELESEAFGLGFTYIPLSIWRKIYPMVKNVEWRTLDNAVSDAAFQLGEKAIIEWDCMVNHNHVLWNEMRGEGRVNLDGVFPVRH